MSVVTCNATAVRFSILLCVAHKLIPTLVKKLLLSFESKCQKNKARRVETSRDENHSENSCPKEKGFLRFEELKLHEGRQIRSQSDSRKTLELLRQGSHRCTCTRGKKGPLAVREGVYSSVSHRSRSRARQKRLATPVRSLIGRQSRRFLPIREICSRGGVVPVCRLDLRGGSVEIIVAR